MAEIIPDSPVSRDSIKGPGEFILCPSCCTIEDVLSSEYDLSGPPAVAKCARCSFTFPILPGTAADITLAAILEHDCLVPDERCTMGERGNWAAVGESIINQMHNLGLSSKELSERMRNREGGGYRMSSPEIHPCAEAVIDLLDEAHYLPESLIRELAVLRGNAHISPDDEAKSKIRGICLRLLEFADTMPGTLVTELYAYLEMLDGGELAAGDGT